MTNAIEKEIRTRFDGMTPSQIQHLVDYYEEYCDDCEYCIEQECLCEDCIDELNDTAYDIKFNI